MTTYPSMNNEIKNDLSVIVSEYNDEICVINGNSGHTIRWFDTPEEAEEYVRRVNAVLALLETV